MKYNESIAIWKNIFKYFFPLFSAFVTDNDSIQGSTATGAKKTATGKNKSCYQPGVI